MMTIGDNRINVAKTGWTHIDLRYWTNGWCDVVNENIHEEEPNTPEGDVGTLSFQVRGRLSDFHTNDYSALHKYGGQIFTNVHIMIQTKKLKMIQYNISTEQNKRVKVLWHKFEEAIH